MCERALTFFSACPSVTEFPPHLGPTDSISTAFETGRARSRDRQGRRRRGHGRWHARAGRGLQCIQPAHAIARRCAIRGLCDCRWLCVSLVVRCAWVAMPRETYARCAWTRISGGLAETFTGWNRMGSTMGDAHGRCPLHEPFQRRRRARHDLPAGAATAASNSENAL